LTLATSLDDNIKVNILHSGSGTLWTDCRKPAWATSAAQSYCKAAKSNGGTIAARALFHESGSTNRVAAK